MNTKYIQENFEMQANSYNMVVSSTPKPITTISTSTPPPSSSLSQAPLSTMLYNENCQYPIQASKYMYQSPINTTASLVSPTDYPSSAYSSYNTNSTPLSSPHTYNTNAMPTSTPTAINTANVASPISVNCNYYMNDQYYQYHDNSSRSYYTNTHHIPTISTTQTTSNASLLVDSNYFSKTSNEMYNSYKQNSFDSSSYVKSSFKSFTIDSILNDKSSYNSSLSMSSCAIANRNKENSQPLQRDLKNDNYEIESKNEIKTKKSRSRGNKRIRTIFTQDQLDKLENEFMRQQYMVGTERYYLANELNLNEAQVKIWFQNRRIKWRKENVDKLNFNRVNNACSNDNNDDDDTNDANYVNTNSPLSVSDYETQD